MKQSEIEAIISKNPQAVFRVNTKYGRYKRFIIVGFTKMSRERFGTPMTYAECKSVNYNEKTGKVTINDNAVSHELIRNIASTSNNSIEEFAVAEQNAKIAQENAVAKREQLEQRMAALIPHLDSALKALDIKNRSYNGYKATKFNIELTEEDAMRLLEALQFQIDGRK